MAAQISPPKQTVRLSKLHILPLLAMVALVTACNPTKRVPQGEYLLVKNSIKSDAKELSDEELRSILKQKPNNKVLGQRLYLHLYNLSDPEKTARIKARSDSACAVKNERRMQRQEEKNARRLAKGKDTKPVKPKDCPRTLRVWLREDVGEAPVVLDSSLTARSVAQLKLYLNKEGYFNAQVHDTVMYSDGHGTPAERGRPPRRPMASVQYRIQAGTPYTLCTVNWFVDDPAIDTLVAQGWSSTLLVPGSRFDADMLDKERTRITDALRQRGYLYFTRDLIHFTADTTAGQHQVDLELKFERPLAKGRRGLAGTPEGSVYRLEDIVVDMSQRTVWGKRVATPDTTTYADKIFLYTGRRPVYRPKALNSSILLKSGAQYNEVGNDRTYRRLTNLRVFDRVDISYDTAQTSGRYLADCRINLLPAKRQSMSLEGYGTNRGGFLGTSVSLNYRHRNLFRGMGSIDARMALGLEAQQTFGRGHANEASTQVGQNVLFNTVELGPEVTIRFPRFMIPFWNSDERWPRTWGRRTAFNTMYNYQQRPDYTRTLGRLGFGYEWNKSRTMSMALYPAEVNLIRIPYMSGGFQQFIVASNDAVLRDSYTDHVVAGLRATFTYNTQEPGTAKRNAILWRPTLLTSGNLLQLANQALGMQQQSDTAGNSFFTLSRVRFAQFVKVENDIRFYHRIHAKSSFAFRIDAGVGIPYGNLRVLPFESSFFSGGANGIRAWRARSLGPGSYAAPLNAYDRVGEIRLEGNAEYRFKLIGYLEGALFVDVGNIWDMHENPAQPGSGFVPKEVPGELAIGTGLGARLNFDFFLVRFDLGLQTKDPALPKGQRWIFQQKNMGPAPRLGQKLNLNLGIGYPF